MSATEARAALPELLSRVLAGDEVTITRHGQPVAVVVRPDALRSRRAEQASVSAQKVGEVLRAARLAPLAPSGAISEARAEELIADVRTGRQGGRS